MTIVRYSNTNENDFMIISDFQLGIANTSTMTNLEILIAFAEAIKAKNWSFSTDYNCLEIINRD